MVKTSSVQGVAKPITAILEIVKVEKEEDKDYSFSRYESDEDMLLDHKLTVITESTGRLVPRIEDEERPGSLLSTTRI